MTPDEQDKFAEYLREHLGSCPRHYLLSFKQFSEQVLGHEIEHWRRLSKQEARAVMKAAAKIKPQHKAA